MIRLAIIDDHASYREALAFVLDREPDVCVVAQAGSLATARQMVTTTAIDVALVDLELPDGSGLELVAELGSATVALVLTGHSAPAWRAMTAAAGAVGLVPKTVGTAEILAAIRQAAAGTGSRLFSPLETAQLGAAGAVALAQRQADQQALAQLTRREREVLGVLTAGGTDQAIADRLCLSHATVRTHVNQVLRKLHVASRLQAALLGVRHGIDPDADPPAEEDTA